MRSLIFFCLILFLSGCEKIAVQMTPAKVAVISNEQQTKQAEDNFWSTLHHGNYDKIPAALKLSTAAYLAHPNDPHLAAHLGFLHIWKIAERQRDPHHGAMIVDQMIISHKYFSDAVSLDPSDVRFQGFLGVIMLGEGSIFSDEREKVHGYFVLKDAINKWPQFNYFTAGYPMSILPVTDEHFKEGLDWQWKTLDSCAHTVISRTNPDYTPFMQLETHEGLDRACWNSWIAPHNFEGFFLNMGDMLVRAGEPHLAIKIYNNAKLSKTYAVWPYREILENRIKNAEKNKKDFDRTSDFNTTESDPNKTVTFNSSFSCMMCHQE